MDKGLSTNSYDPFGMPLLGRSFELLIEYRYGFNNVENTSNVLNYCNTTDFGDRMYDTRTGRWFSIDNYVVIYSPVSPYTFCLNNPIANIDLGGNFVIQSNITGNGPLATMARSIEIFLLQNFVEACKKQLISDPYLMQAFLDVSGFSITDLDIIFSNGFGPVLRFATAEDNIDAIASFSYYKGRTDYGLDAGEFASEILLDYSYFKSGSSFFKLISLLHELVHFGDVADDQIIFNNDFKGYPEYNKIAELSNLLYGDFFRERGSPPNTIEPGVAFEIIATGQYEATYEQYLIHREKNDPTSNTNRKANDKNMKKSSRKKESSNWDQRPLSDDEINSEKQKY